jgi:hypothetical protein
VPFGLLTDYSAWGEWENEKYKELMKKYHPDHCQDTPTLCEEKSKNII